MGQGDGILIQTNRDNYLVDTGGNIMDSFDIGKEYYFTIFREK